MRIGVNTLFLIPGQVGGSETYLRSTLAVMAAEYPEIEWVLFTNDENHALWRDVLPAGLGVEYVHLAFRAANRYMRIVREQTELPWRAARQRLDVLWSPGYTCPFRAGCPQAVSILDMQYKSHPEDLGVLARWTTHVLVRMAAARCARILAISEFAKSEIMRYTSARSERIIEVTPLGVAPDFAAGGEERTVTEAVRRLTGSDTPYLLVVSNTYPHKNVPAAVRAFGEAMDSIPHRLVLVGRPRLGEPAVAAARAALHDPCRMVRLEYVADRRDLIALYRRADVFVHPSLYEGFGLPVLEAMLAGAPVLTTRKASIPEVGQDGVEYFDPAVEGDLSGRLRRMLQWTPAERARRTVYARQLAQGFTWQETARKTVAALRATAEENG